MLIIILILLILFLINLLAYWKIVLKQKIESDRIIIMYKKLFPSIWIICIIIIPIINSSLLQLIFTENISYFHQYWSWFVIIGIIIIILGIKILSLSKKTLKSEINERDSLKLIRKGVYEIVRHPQYLSWILIYLGITFIFDSIIAIIWFPILILLTEILCVLEEKYLLTPKFGDYYDSYKKKTPYRLISPPYNYIFIIMGIIVAYIGLLNILNF